MCISDGREFVYGGVKVWITDMEGPGFHRYLGIEGRLRISEETSFYVSGGLALSLAHGKIVVPPSWRLVLLKMV